jgi:hypothetical protein
MTNLTPDQIDKLTNQFLSLAKSLSRYRFEHWNTLTSGQRTLLGDLIQNILHKTEDILAAATLLLMNEAQSSIDQLQHVTDEMDHAIEKLGSVQKAINVAGAVISLGRSILLQNPDDITASLKALIDAWKQ